MKDVQELIRKLRMIEHDHNKVISEEGGDGPDGKVNRRIWSKDIRR